MAYCVIFCDLKIRFLKTVKADDGCTLFLPNNGGLNKLKVQYPDQLAGYFASWKRSSTNDIASEYQTVQCASLCKITDASRYCLPLFWERRQ
jgi:hypothetical protein